MGLTRETDHSSISALDVAHLNMVCVEDPGYTDEKWAHGHMGGYFLLVLLLLFVFKIFLITFIT